jgi:hypothetical protein
MIREYRPQGFFTIKYLAATAYRSSDVTHSIHGGGNEGTRLIENNGMRRIIEERIENGSRRLQLMPEY